MLPENEIAFPCLNRRLPNCLGFDRRECDEPGTPRGFRSEPAGPSKTRFAEACRRYLRWSKAQPNAAIEKFACIKAHEGGKPFVRWASGKEVLKLLKC